MPKRSGLIPVLAVAVLAVAAYLPSLTGGFLADDFRFVAGNEAVHRLDAGTALRFFTKPATQGTSGRDIYRPLRSLDYAIDWKISGGSAPFFRIRNLLYHLLASILVLALFCRLTPDSGQGLASPSTLGAALFAVHPVHTESVAYISSRGDLLCLVLFLAALLLHLRGRWILAALVLLPALFAKEAAAVFPAAAFLADGLIRRKRPWAAYAAYTGVIAGFTALWLSLLTGSFGQVGEWPGGSYGANLVGVGRALLYYVKNLVFPVDLVHNYHLPVRRTFDGGDIFLALLGPGILLAASLAGRRARFAALWFLAALLPVSGILWPMAIPSTERFLLLPSVGFCLLAGSLLARTRLRIAVLACFLALTASRSLVWRSEASLWEATAARADTPIGLSWTAGRELDQAIRENSREAAARAVEAADAFLRLYRDDIHVRREDPEGIPTIPRTLGGEVLTRKALALLILGQWEPSLAAARDAVNLSDAPLAWEAAGRALEFMGRLEDAVQAEEAAIARGFTGPGPRRRLSGLLLAAGARAESEGDRVAAASLYRRAVDAAPDPETARPAAEALRRVTR